jgi:hypothetical protein
MQSILLNAFPVAKNPGGFGLLHIAALIAALAGAGGSFGLMLHAGRHQNSKILLILFTIWVLSPFVALVLANGFSKRWPVRARLTLYRMMLVLTLGSLAIYGYDAWRPLKAQRAFVFLVVPLASWLLIAMVATAVFLSGRPSRRGDNA